MDVYFDNAATTPLYPEVIKTVTNSLSQYYGNPSSTHAWGRKARSAIETARKEIASLVNAAPQEIIFNSGGTEGINAIFYSALKDLRAERIITSKIEHHAVLHSLPKDNPQIQIDFVNLLNDGSVDLDSLESLLSTSKKKTLVSLMHVNNEIGNILDIDKVGALCLHYGALFHSDAVQSVGKLAIDVKLSQITFLTASAHKFHGPKGVGFMYLKKNSGLKSFILGGSQERGIRAGTEPVHNILGMSSALKLCHDHLNDNHQYISKLKNHFFEGLVDIFEKPQINGISRNSKNSLPNICNVTLPMDEGKAQLLSFKLDLNGIACSHGSACQSGAGTGSHVLKQINNNKSKYYHPSLRFSFSKFNTIKEIDYVLEVLKQISRN